MTATATADRVAARTPVPERLDALRSSAGSDPSAARDEAWEWFAELGRRVRSDRDAALGELALLFRSGSPSRGIEGQTEGQLVAWTLQPGFDRAMSAITGRWLPWLGKRFDATAGRGENLLAPSAKWPSRLAWPLYAMRSGGGGLAAFDFETRVEPGALDPDREVLVIDYAPVDRNPRLVIKRIRDELVEVVPGAHLGRMLWRRGDYGPDARHHLAAYFALREPLPTAS